MTSLSPILAQAWALLEEGAADRRSPFHLIQLATPEPDIRTVVLRGADPATGTIRFHTDARSPKAAGLATDPRVAVLAYDPARRIQLRLAGRAAPEGEAGTDAAWTASAATSRVCYRAAFPPSTPISDPALADPTPEMQAPADPDEGRQNLSRIIVTLDQLEWLHLAASGHRRATFEADDGWRGTWLAP